MKRLNKLKILRQIRKNIKPEYRVYMNMCKYQTCKVCKSYWDDVLTAQTEGNVYEIPARLSVTDNPILVHLER